MGEDATVIDVDVGPEILPFTYYTGLTSSDAHIDIHGDLDRARVLNLSSDERTGGEAVDGPRENDV
jgi:hypothetical protein